MEETKYKQTEIGLIPEDWECFRFDDLFDIGNGYTPSKANPLYWTNGTIPWFRLEDIRKNGRILHDAIQHITPLAIKSGKLFPPYSYILSTTATIGEHALITVASLANQQFSILLKKPNSKNVIDTMYFFYYLYIIGDWCRNNINAGGLNAVNIEDLKNYELVVPSSLAEQHAIASALTSIDNLIASLDKQIAKTNKVKHGAMQQLLTGRTRLKGYNEPWKEKKLGEVAKMQRGTSITRNSVALGDIPVIAGGQAPAYYCNVSNREGETVTISGSGEYAGYVAYWEKPIFVSDAFSVKGTEYCTTKYLYYTLKGMQSKIYATKKGAGVPHVIISSIDEFLIPYPSLVEQHAIASTLTAIDDQISALEAKRRKYEMVKVGMMQQLLTGRIRLK